MKLTAATVLSTALGMSVSASEVPTVKQLVGRWKLSAVRTASESSEHATLSKISDGALSLSIDGEIAKTLGGKVELTERSKGNYVGVAPTGVDVAITVINASQLNFTLKGNGVYFTLFLLK